MSEEASVLAVYDFRSKQAFIYRTNRMREITGASELLAGMYARLIGAGVDGLSIRNDWRTQPRPLFGPDGEPAFRDGEAGAVVYEGGGNLLVLFRSRDAYVAANRAFTRTIAETAPMLKMITGSALWEHSCEPDVSDFEWNRARAYQSLDRAKRITDTGVPANVLPHTLVDRLTFMPVVGRLTYTLNGKATEVVEATAESRVKRQAFDEKVRRNPAFGDEGRFVDDLGLEKGRDSLVAILYFDGNSIGERVRSAVAEGAARGIEPVDAMRTFSLELHKTLVEGTERAMKEAINSLPDEYRGYRVIVDHGDEITFVCNAHAAPFALAAYFSAIEGSGYHACAGMAICHAHDPFAEVYRIAEACCESGKEENRRAQRSGEPDRSLVDFHFCRSGITGTLKQIRSAQEANVTCRPYAVGTGYDAFVAAGRALMHSRLSRSDLKQLNRQILRGESYFLVELERLRAKDSAAVLELERRASGAELDVRCLAFDITSFLDVFDLYFKGADPACERRRA